MRLQTLVFNTTTKTVKVTSESQFGENETIYSFENVPTVKPKEEGYYEVIQKEQNSNGLETNYPVARFPIQNTNMIIEK